MSRTPIVIKISGSFIQPDKPDAIRNFSNVLIELWESGYRPAVVVGGGNTARDYINAARKLGGNESVLDLIGIEVTRLNAYLLILSLGSYAVPYPLESINDILKVKDDPLERIIVMGGLQPGQSTNAVSAILAEVIGAKNIINVTKVDGIYDKDPLLNKDAKLIKKITTLQLRELLKQHSSEAGKYELFDPLSLSIIERSKLIVKVISGKDPENIKKAFTEEVGSVILPSDF
ncbi:UMP kinase [Fervidicoccus fontis]|uniref:Uridylate kinase n=2 Tax=Fervidicoccus fontis TaxID=683846 RepID=I0A1V8_FERFK|nr:UMP kinase [Fervidicoccus fontis]AFH42965.1 Uridylate kinase [Fervidicoccus fontis Kam940]MBE9391479.1 UMP kinase [Fervidicoccus fontis]PMB75484.1 MAG: UMP kinase [Fervidicoccus fontis]PMB77349.1 MAG: UMP kinase [Fervidicoccus fontis]HEW64075.1 UMP kinase [Fervidicoccus fontis]